MNDEKIEMWNEQEQIHCLGMTESKANELIERFGSSKQMVAMSILSDVQAEVEITGSIDDEKLRMTLNLVKFIIAKNMPERQR